jgi:hypothetical protein
MRRPGHTADNARIPSSPFGARSPVAPWPIDPKKNAPLSLEPQHDASACPTDVIFGAVLLIDG